MKFEWGLNFKNRFTDRSFAWEEDSRAGDRTNFNLQCHHEIPSDCQSTFYRTCFSLFLLSVLPQPSILKLWLPSPQSSDYPHLQKNQNLNICVHGNKKTLLKLFMAIQLNLCSWVFSNVCHWTKFQWSLVTAATITSGAFPILVAIVIISISRDMSWRSTRSVTILSDSSKIWSVTREALQL